MKHTLPILILLTSAALCCAAPMINRNGYGVRGTVNPQYFPPAGWSQSLMYLKFTEASSNVLDYSVGGTNTASLVTTGAGVNYAFTNGYFKTSDSTDRAYLQANNTAFMTGISNCTISVWALELGVVSYGAIMLSYNAGEYVGFMQDGSTLRMDYCWKYFNSSPAVPYINFSTNVWNNYTLVRSNSYTFAYLNGSLVGSSSAVVSFVWGRWLIGTHGYSVTTRWWNGYIDDVYITKYLFTPADAMAHYLRGRSP